jgi:hypothetical protein
MKLSELVAYRKLLDDLTPKGTDEFVKSQLGPVLYAIDNHPLKFPELSANLHHARHAVLDCFNTFSAELDHVKVELAKTISAMQPHYLAESYRLYKDMASDSAEYVLNRRIAMKPETESFVQSRVQYYSNWNHAGVILRPGQDSWIENMVACDPLYVIDHSHELLAPVKTKFNAAYQSRLRFYVIKEDIERPMLDQIPDDQIGLVLAFNFFHFKPFEIVRAYLTEIYIKLRPGGIMAFTFNDCDRAGAVKNAENHFMCYTPGSMLESLCESLGFVVRYRHDIDAATTWIELTKPGERSSIRGGQALAELKPK